MRRDRTGQHRHPVKGLLLLSVGIFGVEHHFFWTQQADNFENQAQTDTHNGRQRHAFQLSSTDVNFRAADADDQNDRGQDQVLCFVVVNFDSISTRIPEAPITPYNSRDTPPMTGSGMIWIAAASLPTQESRMAKIAAPPITQVL